MGNTLVFSAPKFRIYVLYKFFCIDLQAVVGACYKFTTVDVAEYGNLISGSTFQASELDKVLAENKLKIPKPSSLPHTQVKAPNVFLGDETYPLLPFLLKP